MQKELIILDEDKAYARARIAELEQQIQALGPEFYEVFNQSSETWHDNAPLMRCVIVNRYLMLSDNN
jgi:hypothetical protein